MKKIINIYYNLINAFKLFIWAVKNPLALRNSNFKMLSDLLAMILKVAEEDRHLMTHIAFVTPENEEHQIVSIWAGAGAGADPIKRISELKEEINELKIQLHNKNLNLEEKQPIK